MSEARVERRLAAILAADVAGYSRLIEADEEGTLAAMRAIRRELGNPKIAEIRQRGDFEPQRRGKARLVVQGAIGPFGCLIEASRAEMSDSVRKGVEKGKRIERAQTARSFDGLDRRLGLVARRVDIPSGHPGVSRVWVERQGAIKSRRSHRRLAGQPKQRHRSQPNCFGDIALGFERLSRQPAGFADVGGG